MWACWQGKQGRAVIYLGFELLDGGFEVPEESVVGAEGEFSAVENHLPRDGREVGIHGTATGWNGAVGRG